MIPPDEVLNGHDVRDALDRFSRLDPAPFSQGLSPQGAAAAMSAALAPLTIDALSDAAMQHPERERPDSVGIVVAQGVFTAPIEWAALYATAGIAVHLKAPEAAPDATATLAGCLRASGLPVSWSVQRQLSDLEAIVVFGDDQTGRAVQAAWPNARVTAFGHRISAALVHAEGDLVALAQALAWDAALYDGRGCMAPVAVVATGQVDALADALAHALAALDETLPPGPRSPTEGVEWRRREALYRVKGRVRAGPRWSVPVVPAAALVPTALPRMLPVVAGGAKVLAGWPLSSLAVFGPPPLHAAAADLAPRVVAPGMLQQPAFPRLHDGVDMLACVLRP